MSTTVTYKGNTLATVSNTTKTLKTAGKYMEDDVQLTDTSSTIVVSETLDTNGGIIKTISTTDEVNLQVKTIAPTTIQQTVNPDTGYDGFSQVIVGAGSGGGLDIPIFTITYDENYEIDSVTCNKTFNQIQQYFNGYNTCAILIDDQEEDVNYPVILSGYDDWDNPTYANLFAMADNGPVLSFKYYANGTITTPDVYEFYEFPTFTQNGDYYPSHGKAFGAAYVAVPSSSPSLQTKTKTYTPTETAQSETVTADSGYDGLSSVEISVGAISNTYVGSQVPRVVLSGDSDLTPSETRTLAMANGEYLEGGDLYVAAIPSTYVGTGITRRSSSDLTASGATVTVPSGYYASQATKSVTSGTAGTPTATKGSVSNHSISVTPSVTNTTGYITGSTKTGTAVTVSASELVSGSETKTSNGTYDVTNLAELIVNVSGGGGGDTTGIQIGTTSTTATSNTSLTFTGLAGAPTSLVIISTDEIATQSTPHVATIAWDGNNTFGQEITNTSNAQVTAVTNGPFMPSYNNGTLTVGLSGVEVIDGNDYNLIYTYNGSDIRTSNVQVGSGATSITFTGIEEEPSYFSCIFKSNFSTSNGYQRAIAVVYDGTDIYGLEMDSSAKPSNAHWSYTYNNGSLTITSQGTNAGGYFHQPGYYQLTYAIGSSGGVVINNQNKSVAPSETQQTITADEGYTGLGTVTVGAISSTYVGSSIARRGDNNMSGAADGEYFVVSAAAGYYQSSAEYYIPLSTAGTPTATKGTVSNHSISVTPSVTNTTGYITGSTKTGTAVTVTASELASGNKAITQNGTGIDVVGYSTVSVNVPNNDVWKPIQAQTRTIIEDPDGNYLWYDNTTPAFAEGQTWRVTWGNETYVVQTKYVEINNIGYWVIGNPGAIGYTDDGTGYSWIAWNQNSSAIVIGTSETGSKKVILELQQSNPYQAKTVTYTPSETQQTATVVPDSGYNGLSTVGITVNAISSTYVGSGIARKSSTDLTVSGATVTAPAGYYSASASKSVSSMTLPTSAASSATSGYTSKATIGRSTAAQYINIPPGYNSTGAYYVISAVANGSATAPASISGTAASVSTGTNTLTLTKTVSVTPTVSAGYVSSGTAGNSSVSLTASVTTKAAATITPTTTNQTIAAGTYLTGTQTIAGDADLVGSNILSTANIFGVQGTVVVQNYYTGSSAPSSSTGSNGDLYLQS